MVSVTLSITEDMKFYIDHLPWVNWSELSREEARKKEIFETYMKTNNIPKEDAKFCKEIDWHPVDELPLREEYIKRLRKISKGKHHKMTLKELDKLLEL